MAQELCLITGAAGFVGRSCARLLRAQGLGVREIGRSAPKGSDLYFALGDPINPALFDSAASLVHCAYDFRAESWNEIEKINVRGSIDLFETAKAGGVSRLVFISSVSAFEGCRSLYGRGKLEVEKEVLRMGGLVIRPGLVWDDSERGMHGRLKRLARLPILPIFGSGREPFVLVHAEDLARCVSAALRMNLPSGNSLITAANPQPVAFADILKSLAKRQGRRARVIPMPAALGLGLLRTLETLGLPAGFRSDSLRSLLYPNPNMDFETQKSWGVEFRPYPA
ncbi:MAG TPA: NAD-dependent epimerase/dehydratase family protein [Elusimicrobiota bacterium]|nr:NAD-dependent epimerase/dehydratase family protein [Elusimicrobiota bacterium]